ncbi:MAG: hypothetical protein ACOX6Q_02065 [Candidatus Dojkabacteria bacterium]|jgi:hypothetical protein
MTDTPVPKKPRNFLKERISRFKPIVFLKKNLPLFILIFLFLLSYLLGLWNVRKYEILSHDGTELDPKVVDKVEKYIEENVVGRNFFSIHIKNLEQDITRNISYADTIKIEKNVPNSLTLFLKQYSAELVGLTKGNKCYLLSSSGVVLEELCKESTEENCCIEYSTESKKYILKVLDMDIVVEGGEKGRLLVMDDIKKIVKMVKLFEIEIQNITIEKNVVTVLDADNRKMIFSVGENINTQLESFYLVMAKIKRDNINFDSVDVRFERPVMKVR